MALLADKAQAQYNFSFLQTRDGLSSNGVNCIVKDSDGFIWAGTSNGLNRFDGSGFKVYSHRNKNLPLYISENIRTIYETAPGILLFTTNKGAATFNKLTGDFKNIPFITAQNKVQTNFLPVRLVVDHHHRVWLHTNREFYLCHNDTAFNMQQINSELEKHITLVSDFISLNDSIRNGMWIGSVNGLFFYDYKTEKMQAWWNNPQQLPVFTKEYTVPLLIDKSGKLWCTKRLLSLSSYDFKTGATTVLDMFNKIAGQKLNTLNLFEDHKNNIWVSSWQGYFFVIENNGAVNLVKENLPGSSNPISLFVPGMIEDEEKNLWLATAAGISKISYSNPVTAVYNATQDKYTIDYFKRLNTTQWILIKSNGISIYDEEKQKTTNYPLHQNPGSPIPNRLYTFEEVNGEYWCGTLEGIKIFNPHSKQYREVAGIKNFPSGIRINNIKKDKRGNIWFSSPAYAIFRYEPLTNAVYKYDGSNTAQGDIKPVNWLFIDEDSKGRIWVGNGENGVRLFDYTVNSFYKFPDSTVLSNSIVNTFAEDKNHTIWLSTYNNGVMQVDENGKLLNHYTSAQGLSTNNVNFVFTDEDNTAWFTTGDALHYIQPGNNTIRSIPIRDDNTLYSTNSVIHKEGSKILVSVENYIKVIETEKLRLSLKNKTPLISSVSVFEKEVYFNQQQPQIYLNYNENFFTIEFSSPYHKDIPSLQYAYKLEGLNKDWVYCGRRQIASFSNLPHGNYTFLVKTTDANGRWNDEVKKVVIQITPPFWKTNWFITLLVLIIAVLMVALYKRRQKKIQKQHIEKTIDYFANSVYGENSVNEICWDIARNCISQLHFEDCVVYLVDEKKNKLIQKAAYGPKNPKGHEIDNPIEIEIGKGIVGAAAQTGKPLLIPDTSKDSRYIVDDEQRFSELAVPVMHDNKVIGVIDSEHRQKNFFTEAHVKALSTIASISANKIAEAQAKEQAKENEIKLLDINRMLAESQLMALRAQMNPHFVFNCLNSIQECIVTQKYGEASNYLNKFSKLFRMVLNNSGKNLVTVEEEAEVLRLYLELELMRFEKSFSYEIKIDENLEAEEILIPSMLIQPYVENALWHGLMHKEGERKLSVVFEKLNEEVFRCTVDDNGIGRKKSFELKAQQSKSKRHESKGLKISKDRLDVLQKQGYHAALEVTDKYDAEQNPQGTKICIELSTDLST